MNAVGAYVRVSTSEQADSGLGLAAQRAAILAEALRRGWAEADITWFEDAGFSGKDLKRPGIAEALDALRHHRLDTLVVAKLDRLSRSLLDFSGILDRATREHWAVIALDLAVDTASPSGEMMANVLMTFARFERRLISERTKVALAQKVAQGWKPGRWVLLSKETRARIVAETKAGDGPTIIARRLQAEGVPTAQGGKWYASTIAAALRSEALGTPRKEQTDD